MKRTFYVEPNDARLLSRQEPTKVRAHSKESAVRAFFNVTRRDAPCVRTVSRTERGPDLVVLYSSSDPTHRVRVGAAYVTARKEALR